MTKDEALQSAHITLTAISTHPTLELSDFMRGKIAAAVEAVQAALTLTTAAPPSWAESLKIAMQHSAWDGVLQLDDALRNIDDAALAAPAAPSVPQWRPIETAPKTGRKIIVAYTNRNVKSRTVMARWLTDEQAAETDADGVGLEGGWYECIDNWDDYTEVAIHEGEPTHWMPLPAAPTDVEQG